MTKATDKPPADEGKQAMGKLTANEGKQAMDELPANEGKQAKSRCREAPRRRRSC